MRDLREHYYAAGVLMRPVAAVKAADGEEDEAPFIAMTNLLNAFG